MADDIATLGIKVDSKQVKAGALALDKLGKEAKSAESTTKKLAVSMKSAFAGISAALLVKDLFKTNIEIERLEASLVTVTGSAELAAVEFDKLRDFSKEVPGSLSEVTRSFIKLKAFGLDATIESMKSYANTAAALGYSTNQMVEAVADAITGEFERLKEFGITTKTIGDNVDVTFAGITKTIGKNAKEIQAYLLDLGKTNFAGAVDRQMKTLGGSISNLGVAWDNFLDILLSTKTSNAISKSINFISKNLDDITSQLEKDSPMVLLQQQTEDAKKEFEFLLSEYHKARLLRINPFQSTEDLATDVEKARIEYEKLQAEIWTTGTAFKDIVKVEDEITDNAYKMGAAMKKSLSDAVKAASDTKNEFKELYDDITAPAEKAVEDVGVLDVAGLQLQAETSIRKGDFDSALVKARQAFELVDKLKEAGRLSDLELQYYAESLRKIGEEAGAGNLAEIQIKIDNEKARASMSEAEKVMQDHATANPIIQPIIFQVNNKDIEVAASANVPSGATQQASNQQTDYRPTIIQMPDGSEHTVYSDQNTADSFAESVRKQAAKRGGSS